MGNWYLLSNWYGDISCSYLCVESNLQVDKVAIHSHVNRTNVKYH